MEGMSRRIPWSIRAPGGVNGGEATRVFLVSLTKTPRDTEREREKDDVQKFRKREQKKTPLRYHLSPFLSHGYFRLAVLATQAFFLRPAMTHTRGNTLSQSYDGDDCGSRSFVMNRRRRHGKDGAHSCTCTCTYTYTRARVEVGGVARSVRHVRYSVYASAIGEARSSFWRLGSARRRRTTG